jgi:hypothetical protein
VILAGSLLFKNWQRPGAIVNATLQEFKACKLMQRDEKASLYIMAAKEHKTAQEEYAKVVMEGVDYARIVQYKVSVRKCLDVEGTASHLFILSGGRKVTKLSSRVQSLGKKFGLTLPTATRVRKIGATSVALNVGDSATAQRVTRQLSHSAATESEYYQAIVGDSHTIQAFQSMEDLRRHEDSQCMKDEEQVTPSRRLQKKRMFTAEETASVAEHFECHVKEKRTPSLDECKAFVQKHQFDRSGKSIQDKSQKMRELYWYCCHT